MSQWAVGAAVSEEEGGRPAGGVWGVQSWRRMGKEGERERERSQPRDPGTADPFPLGASLPALVCLCS